MIPIALTRRTYHGLAFAAVGFTLWLSGGCALYQYGPSSLYRSDIKTVHVPIVRNRTFRHDLGVRLTEAVVREIELRTPYKVTGDPNADSSLLIEFNAESKGVLTETASDDPRALDMSVSVQANWMSRQGELLMQNTVVPNSGTLIAFGQTARFVPEAGQSVDTAVQDAIEKLASRIVSQMEFRW
ncbi:hypothetical protein CA13_69280 [Planctomycetes bacterium CA13]|uniref:Lipopolysaccharide-assembly n=1 Tax=Novipirellula herctigrandis TaxID=2527986 RepID=A0A5C5YNG0_9BACT|nr:hypothetical protein CA13_69280 [Planctomycetes bacterium CA13]